MAKPERSGGFDIRVICLVITVIIDIAAEPENWGFVFELPGLQSNDFVCRNHRIILTLCFHILKQPVSLMLFDFLEAVEE